MPEARVMIIWMVGEYSSVGVKIPRMLTTVLKYLAWCFKSEAVETKLQILNTTIKVLLRTWHLIILEKCFRSSHCSTFPNYPYFLILVTVSIIWL